jgi:hypothetical protein
MQNMRLYTRVTLLQLGNVVYIKCIQKHSYSAKLKMLYLYMLVYAISIQQCLAYLRPYAHTSPRKLSPGTV